MSIPSSRFRSWTKTIGPVPRSINIPERLLSAPGKHLRVKLGPKLEHRKSKRFDIELPVEVKRAGASRTPREGLTCNISSAGVLFASQQETELGDVLEYVITLPSRENHQVNIRCMGKVVRCEPSSGIRYHFQVAVTMERYEFVRP
jgi:hypothetical protein